MWLDPEPALDHNGLCPRSISGSSGYAHSLERESQEFSSYQSLVNLVFTERLERIC